MLNDSLDCKSHKDWEHSLLGILQVDDFTQLCGCSLTMRLGSRNYFYSNENVI